MSGKLYITPPVKKEILSVGVSDASRTQVLEYVFSIIEKTTEKVRIYTPNPEIVMFAAKHESYRKILNQAEVSLCDGVGLFTAGKWLGKPLPSRISGVDFLENLCKESVSKGVSVGFLGGRNGVAERASNCLSKKYPGLKVVFVGEEWSEDGLVIRRTTQNHTRNTAESSSVQRNVPHSSAVIDILFVGYGFPKQEEWINDHIKKLPVRVMMGVGGAFDIISGDIKRAPSFMRQMGLEWLYRLIREPWRIKRQLVLPQFLLLVLSQKLRIR